jgi:transposase-like protein
MGKRSYTPEQRTQALELYRTDGPTTVEEQLGIPKQTVDNWAKRAGVRTVRNEKTAEAVEAARLTWEQRRLGLAHESGSVAQLALAKARENLADGRARDAQAAATTYAILVDKAQLLTGAATSRHETVSNVDAEIERLSAELNLTGGHDPVAA